MSAPIFLIFHAQAAIELSLEESDDGWTGIIVEGEFELGDEKRFLNSVASIEDAIVFLNSSGGNPIAAMEIGRVIRFKNFITAVSPQSLCASACALAWLGGKGRVLDENAALGFHASYIKENGKLLETGLANALIGRYLTQLDLPEAAVIFVTSAPPEGMNWLNRETAIKTGIQVEFINSVASHDENQMGAKQPSNDLYDPITVASKFYSYLSRGEGSAAAALIIPEKRGKGPFNEKSMAEYFGSLQVPLKVENIRKIDDNQIAITYSYSHNNGIKCNTTANVYTTYAYGRTLIEKIIAKC